MSKHRPGWLEYIEDHLTSDVDQTIKDADHAIHDFALHVHLSHWHPISTAPYNQDVELRVAEGGTISTLEFPCRKTNDGDWINVDLGTRIEILPTQWRVWQHSKSPLPHHSTVKPGGRLAPLYDDRESVRQPPQKKRNS
jgi:hypothetical protein